MENYGYALQIHPDFSRVFTEVLVKLATELPLIIAYSFFAATLLNQDFKGRGLVRAMFFLPVILGAGVVMKMEVDDYSLALAQSYRKEIAIFSGDALRNMFELIRFPDWLLDYVVDGIESLPAVIRASGVQILIFLAGLQGIPREVYEAADVEGANGWEQFWMITFPMLTPLILTNIVYTIIDSFTSMDNELVRLIRETMLRGAGYGVSMAMSMLYFAVIGVVLVVVFGLLSKRVFYNV